MKENCRNPKIVKAGKYIHLLRIGSWEFVCRANCTGIVIIIAMTDDEKVIFTEQLRVPVGKKVIEFPAGLVNDQPGAKNESMAAAAKRELWEETGFRARRMVKLLEGPAASGSSSDILTFYKAEGLTKTGKGGGDETENIAVHEIPLASAEEWLKKQQAAGYLVDPKIYAGLYFLNKYNKRDLH